MILRFIRCLYKILVEHVEFADEIDDAGGHQQDLDLQNAAENDDSRRDQGNGKRSALFLCLEQQEPAQQVCRDEDRRRDQPEALHQRLWFREALFEHADVDRHQQDAEKPAGAVDIDHRAVGKAADVVAVRFEPQHMRRCQQRCKQQSPEIDHIKKVHLLTYPY